MFRFNDYVTNPIFLAYRKATLNCSDSYLFLKQFESSDKRLVPNSLVISTQTGKEIYYMQLWMISVSADENKYFLIMNDTLSVKMKIVIIYYNCIIIKKCFFPINILFFHIIYQENNLRFLIASNYEFVCKVSSNRLRVRIFK